MLFSYYLLNLVLQIYFHFILLCSCLLPKSLSSYLSVNTILIYIFVLICLNVCLLSLYFRNLSVLVVCLYVCLYRLISAYKRLYWVSTWVWKSLCFYNVYRFFPAIANQLFNVELWGKASQSKIVLSPNVCCNCY